MQNQEQFLALLRDALERIFESHASFKPSADSKASCWFQLRNRFKNAELPGDPIVEQEYQKTIPLHGLNIRPEPRNPISGEIHEPCEEPKPAPIESFHPAKIVPRGGNTC